MNYIYDVILNFQPNYYQFFEWNKKDKIKNIMKIPLYKVTDKDLLILKDNIIKIDTNFLNKIKKDNKNYQKNICLISNGKISIGLLFDKNGYLTKKSSLIYEEEDEVNDIAKNLQITTINYIVNKEIFPKKDSRISQEKKDLIISYLNKLKDISTLKYLYYEYFKEECINELTIKEKLIQELKKDWTNNQNNLYHTIKLLLKNNLPAK